MGRHNFYLRNSYEHRECSLEHWDTFDVISTFITIMSSGLEAVVLIMAKLQN